MAHNSSENKEDVDIKPVINSQSHENAQISIKNDLNGSSQTAINMKQDPKSESNELNLDITSNKPASQNGTADPPMSSIDLTRPLKTEGEVTSGNSSTTVSVVHCTTNSTPVVTTAAVTTQAGAPTGNATSDSSTSFGMFGAQGLSGLTSQMNLTPEEQSAAYRRANILALSALARNGGPNAKEMLAVQQKLQEFLTSLISLAGQKGPELKIRVQQLVQNLVTGQVSEDDFATQIEKDLQSQHQPSLLPFLKNSVPHLKTRLQLQQAIMKELLQRQEREKSGSTPSTPSQLPPPTPQPSSAVVKQKPVKTVSTQGVSITQALTQFPTGSTVSKPIVIGAGLPVKNSTNTTPSGVQSLSMVAPVGQLKVPTAPQASSSSTTGISSTPNKTGITTAASAIVLQPALIQQLSQQLPKNVRDQIAKLPPEQQKMVYLHHFKRLQMLKQQQLQSRQNTASPTTGSSSGGNTVTNAQIVRARQEQLVKEQQVPLIMGKGGVTSSTNKPLAVGGSALVNSDTTKSTFANMKLSSSSLSVSGASPSKGKKGKGKGKDIAVDANEEEDEGMDILDEVGVNLQEESAQFLPPTEGTAGSVQDKAFLDVTQLRRKVGMIARRYGVGDVSDDYLYLLSHAAEARLKDVLEKLTQISQHRTEALKDNSQYSVKSEVRGQLRVLETIDRIIDKRKTERENEQTLKAAKSRSKGADPVKAAQLREEARQIQEDKAAIIRDQAANETALKAIGSRRKRPSPQSDQPSGVAGNPGSSGATSSLFAPLSVTRAPKRHVTSRDLIFYLEQERETRKSLTLYKTLLK